MIKLLAYYVVLLFAALTLNKINEIWFVKKSTNTITTPKTTTVHFKERMDIVYFLTSLQLLDDSIHFIALCYFYILYAM